mmetsp:Transcript_58568/g.188229  ORF Transcript_58568/g.188229 Transcript_58568/m.188229 type:complete len:179 (-) Transcript_58568:705-1241(-)
MLLARLRPRARPPRPWHGHGRGLPSPRLLLQVLAAAVCLQALRLHSSGGAIAWSAHVDTWAPARPLRAAALAAGIGRHGAQRLQHKGSGTTVALASAAGESPYSLARATKDPFAKVEAVLRQTKLDRVSSLLDGSVDVANVPLRRAIPGAGGKLASASPASSLWATNGALIVAVRRPG